MRISKIEAIPVAIPLAQVFHWSGGVQSGANLVVFAVHTDDGLVGYGESVCEDPRAIVAYAELISQQVIGHSAGDVEAILREIWTVGRWRTTPQFTQFIVAGIEVACWDVLGKTLEVPSRTFFGGSVNAEIDYFAFLQGDDPETLAAHARDHPEHQVVYFKIGRQRRDDEACVAAVREVIGPDRLLRVDPNEAWDAATAVERIRTLDEYELDWVEQPVPHFDIAGLAHVRRSIRCKVAADQAVYTTAQLRAVLEREACDVVVQGSHDAGGLLRLRQQAFLTEAHGLKFNMHAFMQSDISFFAQAQVASTIPNLTVGNQMMHQLLAERLTATPSAAPGGRYRLNDQPGHGFTIDLDAVAHAHERWQRDGAYKTIESGR